MSLKYQRNIRMENEVPNTFIYRPGGCSSILFRSSKKERLQSVHIVHAHYLAKGGDFKKMIAEIYEKKQVAQKEEGAHAFN